MNVSKHEQRVLHALAQGGAIHHLRDEGGRIVAADCITRDGFVLPDCTLAVFRRLKQRGLIASRGGRPYAITRLGLLAVRAQLDNRLAGRIDDPCGAADQRAEHPGAANALGAPTLFAKDRTLMENDAYTRTGSADATDTAELNTLIGTLIDSIEGYQKAAADTENSRFAEMFNARARERQQALTGLQAAVARLGGNPEDDGTTAGAVHRGWINLKEAVLGRDDEAIVNSVESGEDYLKEKFEAALRHTDLPAEARSAVEQAWQSVKAGHDEMSQLKHAIS